MRTYGSLVYRTVEGRDRPEWVIVAEPHVMIRLKRFFGRIRRNRIGEVMLTDTTEVARDIEWFLERFPLDMDEITHQRLHDRAADHRAREATIERILTGSHNYLDLAEPARPARDYQQSAAELAIATGRLLCTDEVGLGKSMTGALVFRAPDALPGLVVTLTHLPSQWVDEINKTLPWLKCHIVKSGVPYALPDEPDVLVMNYHKLAGWADHLTGKVRTVVFDEAQELRRAQSQKYDAAGRIADAARYRVGLTASPVYNYGGEIHNVMQILAPDALGNREEFLREWGHSSGGDHIHIADPAALGSYLRDQGLMLGRTRKEVGRELPDVIRITQTVQADEDELDRLTGDAVEMARLVMSKSTSAKDRWKASGELDWKLRQATGIAKAPYVAEFVRLLLESERQVVLFGWHRAVYDLWAERLQVFDPAFYTGEESPTQKRRSEEAFKAGDARVLIMSLRAGAGLDGLQDHAHVAVFGELDWSPEVHKQCIGRLHRDGQDEPVVAYFLVSDDGADPVIADVLQLKRQQSEPMLNPEGDLFQHQTAGYDRVKLLASEVLRRAKPDDEVAS